MDAITRSNPKILSVGTYLPEEIVSSVSLFEEINSEQYNLPTTWMRDKMGIVERRMSPEDAKPSDLAIPAAQKAIDQCDNLDPDLINLVIFCGIERDQPEPATAHVIQNSLGLNAKHVFDVSNACFGFMEAIEIAQYYMRGGATSHALIVTGEVPTKVLRAAVEQLKAGVDLKTARDLIGALSVGDAGGAVVMGPSYGYEQCGFRVFNTITDSSHIDKCIYKQNPNGEFVGQMQMGKIVSELIQMHNGLIGSTLSKLGWDEFDWMLTHQIGEKPFQKFSAMQGVGAEKMIKTFHKLGNITSASFPINYEKLQQSGKVLPGDKIGGCFTGSGLSVGQFGYVY